jgi:hypothetical protein
MSISKSSISLNNFDPSDWKKSSKIGVWLPKNLSMGPPKNPSKKFSKLDSFKKTTGKDFKDFQFLKKFVHLLNKQTSPIEIAKILKIPINHVYGILAIIRKTDHLKELEYSLVSVEPKNNKDFTWIMYDPYEKS